MATTKGDKRLLPTHTSPQRPSAKRARLELSAVPVAHLERQNRDAQANLLEAGRISALLSVKRRDEDHQKIAWSSQNIIAFSRGDGSLELAHVSNSERTHILACHGNRDHRTLDILSFSPRGDALFACYSSGIAFLWTKEIALNRWRLVTTGKKASFSLILPGKAVVSQWLAQPKRKVPSFKRTCTHGPQFLPGTTSTELALLVLCEEGHVALIRADVRHERLSLHTTSLFPLRRSDRIAHAAVGLVPDESRVLLACRLARTSKSVPSSMAPADDALGMFFRDRLASSASALRIEDGQEKVHLFELQIALCNQAATLVLVRPLAPIFVGQPPLRLIWIDYGDASSLDLIVAFKTQAGSVLKSWHLRRSQHRNFTSTFSSLEATKTSANGSILCNYEDDKGKEEWKVNRKARSRLLRGRTVLDLMMPSHNDCILCTSGCQQRWSLASVNAANTTREVQACALDGHTLDFVQQNEVIACNTGLRSRVVISPNDVLAAAVTARGRLTVFQSPKGVLNSTPEGQLVVSSFLQQNDFADLSRVMRKNNLVKKSLKHFGMAQPPRASQQLRLLELRLAIDQCRRSRLFLELAHFFRLMRISRIGSRYDLKSAPALLASIAWLHALFEDLARASYLLCEAPMQKTDLAADEALSEKTRRGDDDAEGDNDDVAADTGTLLLGLLTLSVPRKVVVHLIGRVEHFRDWLVRNTATAEGLRPLWEDEANLKRQSLAIDDLVAMARAQLQDIEAKSQISLDGLAKLLHSETQKEKKDSTGSIQTRANEGESRERDASAEREDDALDEMLWVVRERLSRGRSAEKALARQILQLEEKEKGRTVNDLLSLFVPEIEAGEQQGLPSPGWFDDRGGTQWSKVTLSSTNNRDIVTKMPLPDSKARLTCLRCDGQTFLGRRDDSANDRCLCGGAWWA